MKKSHFLLCVPIMICIGACAREEQTADTDYLPPIDGMEWGMTPEEAAEILSLPEDCILDVEGISYIRCEDRNVLGQDADVEMTFDMRSRTGLLNVSVFFKNPPEESFLDTLNSIYGEYSAIDRKGGRGLWKNDRIVELPERIQERFRYVWENVLLWNNEEQNAFSADVIWDAKKDQALVTVSLDGSLLNYNGGNMAAYRIYSDDEAYGKWLGDRGISQAEQMR